MPTSCKKICSPFRSDAQRLCKARKACACDCEAKFKGINPAIAESCISQCWSDPDLHGKYGSIEEYLCSNFDHQELFNRHGYLCEGFDIMEDSVQGKVYQEEQAAIAEQSSSSRKVIIGAAILMVILLIVYLRM